MKSERNHEYNISKLLEEFSNESRDFIERTYVKNVADLEQDAKVKRYIPLIAYKNTKETLMALNYR
jgi:hypothetical protein